MKVAISRSFGAFQLTVEFDTSGVVVLFGPSGAGKSLTLKMIAGLETPDAGLIRIGDRTVFDSAAGINLSPQHRHVGYVPQNYAVFPHLSAIDNVAYPLRRARRGISSDDARRRAGELLGSLGLAGREDARPSELSGGQLQRVAFARALATDPDILLLDEPFAALDAPIRAELRSEFRRVQRELGIPAVFITHDIEEAAMLADRLIVLIGGRLHQSGQVREILDRPADPEVAQLVQARNLLRGTVTTCGSGTAIETPVGTLQVDGEHIQGTSVVAVIRSETIRIVREDRGLDRLQGLNILRGRITDLADFGTRIAVFVRAGDGDLEISLAPTAAANLQLTIGRDIRLAIPPERIHIIPDQQTG